MAEEKKSESLTGQRRLESQYAESEGKYQMLFVYLSLGTMAIIAAIFIGIIAPAREKRHDRALADLKVLAKAANLYWEKRNMFPESLEELVTFLRAHRVEEDQAVSLRDPWDREYYYFNISDDRGVCISSGRNRRLDLDLDDLSPPTEYEEFHIRVLSDGIYTYDAGCDDWVILAGSWPSRKK